MHSNNILNFQESTIILNACTKIVWKFIKVTTYNVWTIVFCYSTINASDKTNMIKFYKMPSSLVRNIPKRNVQVIGEMDALIDKDKKKKNENEVCCI